MTSIAADDGAYRADHVDKNALRIGRQIGLDGAMGQVFEVEGGQHFYKEYHDAKQHEIRIERLIEWRNRLPAEHRALLDRHCAWPQTAVTIDGAIAGFLMSPAPDEFWADMLGERHTRELQHLIHAQVADPLGIAMPTLAQRLELVASLAYLLAFLAQHKIVYGDVNEKNVLWTIEGIPRIYLIDCDNARPADMPPEIANVAMPRNDSWRDPDLADGAPPDLASDRYSLAVFCYRVFYGVMVKIEKDRKNVLIPPDVPELPRLEDQLRKGLARPWHRPSHSQWVATISMIDRSTLDQAVPASTAPGPPHQPRSEPAATPSPPPTVSYPAAATRRSPASTGYRPGNSRPPISRRPRTPPLSRQYSQAQMVSGAFAILIVLLIILIIIAVS